MMLTRAQRLRAMTSIMGAPFLPFTPDSDPLQPSGRPSNEDGSLLLEPDAALLLSTRNA
jgi:hypothetical protein